MDALMLVARQRFDREAASLPEGDHRVADRDTFVFAFGCGFIAACHRAHGNPQRVDIGAALERLQQAQETGET